MPPRFLITTADERTWDFNQPTLFLGEWCRRYHRRSIWENLDDAIVAEPFGLDAQQNAIHVDFIQSKANELVVELTDALNRVHQTGHGIRYWQIVLGHWLERYVGMAFNRYSTLKQALENYSVSATKIYDSSGYSLATTDSASFIWACNDDVWNHVFYSRVLEFLGKEDLEICELPKPDTDSFRIKGQAVSTRFGIKNFVRHSIDTLLPKFCRDSDAFIVNSALPLSEEIRLQLSLGQVPQKWRSPAPQKVDADRALRKNFFPDNERHQGFDSFVRSQLSEVLPTCFLEGYKSLARQADAMPWPAKPRFIYTANNFDTDEVFKVWCGSKVENGIPYFVGQHGNNYETLIGSDKLTELLTCDKFFTWGWENSNPKYVPAFNFKVAGREPARRMPEGGVLLIELHPPHRFVPEDSYFEFGIYQQQQFRFVDALPELVRQKLTIRLHHAARALSWSDGQRWKDYNPATPLDSGAAPIQELIAGSRVVVHSYDSSGILETLAMNIPTLCFWHGGFDHLLPDAKPFYELLREAGVLADSPEQAAATIAAHWDDIGAWWESKKVQDARNAFCDKYSRLEKRPVRTMKLLLTVHENKRRNEK